MKTKSPKLSKETLIKIWQASRPNIYKNKKKYTRKFYRISHNPFYKFINFGIYYKKYLKNTNTLFEQGTTVV